MKRGNEMTDWELLEAVNSAKENFGNKCNKYTGSLTVELLKYGIEETGIHLSSRDSFILSISREIDLIIPKPGVESKNGILYEAKDVLGIIEVKNYGSFGEPTLNSIRENFSMITNANPMIYCIYVTLAERHGYNWAVTKENIKYPAYTLFWQKGKVYSSSGDWENLIADIRTLIEKNT